MSMSESITACHCIALASRDGESESDGTRNEERRGSHTKLCSQIVVILNPDNPYTIPTLPSFTPDFGIYHHISTDICLFFMILLVFFLKAPFVLL